MQKVIIEQAKKLYGFDSDTLELLGGFDNNVFLGRDQNIVIKFLDTTKYNKENIEQEFTIINLMDANSIKTPVPIPSQNGNLLEVAEGFEKNYFIIAFAYIEGKVLLDYEEDHHLIKQWGRMSGEMHEVSKKNASRLNGNYSEWNFDINDKDFAKESGTLIQKKWGAYMERLSSLLRTHDLYGVVHHDLHNENIIISNNKMYVLDFGDVRKSWYMYDACIPIYHALEKNRRHNSCNGVVFYERFRNNFFEGYCEKTTLSKEQYELLPFFLEYRLLYSYLFFTNSFTANTLSTETKNILDDMRCRIENDVPFIY
ncbi:Ser/Thr protein kinase RdoA (MazF antagonist) [Sporosarcina luteola]|nr:Ser/Thr protein kinase RdoA (MazF antagonist) [Sporosarcina luteola]